MDEAKGTADNNEGSKLLSTEEKLAKLSEDVASQKSVGELIKLLVYFWAAISGVLGALGWSKFSDLDKVVEAQVQAQLPRDKQEFAKYQELVAEAERLNKKYKELSKSYEESVSALQYAKTVGADFDIEGQLTILISESRNRQGKDKDEDSGSSGSLEGSLLEPKWRKDSIATLMLFRESLAKKKFPADFIFNVTQVTRALNQFQLAEDLTKAAYEKDATPPIRALYLSSKVKNTTGQERETSFKDLLGMVADLPNNSPEIVLAEAWNAAEDQRRYGEFIAAIDKLIAARKTPVSYAHVIRANAILRESFPQSLERADASLKLAAEALAQESAMASWFASSLREYQSARAKIQASRRAATLVSMVSAN